MVDHSYFVGYEGIVGVRYYSHYYEDWMPIEMVWREEQQTIWVMRYPGLNVEYDKGWISYR